MHDIQAQRIKPALPFKSVAAALLFSLILGPIGLLYATVWGGISLLILGAIIIKSHLYGITALLWLVGLVWGVIAVDRYNRKIVHAYAERL